MTNHPNRSKTKYVVAYTGDKIARFQDFDDAVKWARQQPWSEIHCFGKRGGIGGQYDRGRATPEFQHLDA